MAAKSTRALSWKPLEKGRPRTVVRHVASVSTMCTRLSTLPTRSAAASSAFSRSAGSASGSTLVPRPLRSSISTLHSSSRAGRMIKAYGSQRMGRRRSAMCWTHVRPVVMAVCPMMLEMHDGWKTEEGSRTRAMVARGRVSRRPI